MEEELNYASVNFKYNGASTQENRKTAPSSTPLQVAAACLGILCVVLISVIVLLTVYYKSSRMHYNNLTAQNQQLWAEKTSLERQTKELTRERDALNWTVGIILEYDNFSVNSYCSQKVCKPCLEGWELFQSSCYFFTKQNFSSLWKNWTESQQHCREYKAHLVVIGSEEEQEFISNHSTWYHDDLHGYWTGFSKMDGEWRWVDGSSTNVTYWMSAKLGSCMLTVPQKNLLDNWDKVGCDMKNRWICETKALIKS
uniref:C-type lectin domain-containing protein n=1 Tax=Myripristis murdjan TaxID=586833 RepID=A0A667WRQ8_9TELE